MEQVKGYVQKFESFLEKVAGPVKPHMPVIARFLLVVTFYEDSLRIITQWDDQVFFLRKHRSMVGGSAQLFLFLNVIVMLVASTLAVARRYTEYAVAGLSLVVVAQSIGYGFIFDSSFFFRALSVVGGLLMLLADAFASSKSKVIFAGLPSINETDKNSYIQLFARILLVGLFLSFIMQGEFTFLRLTVSAIALVGCVMVVVGFKARWSAWMLVAFLSIFNVVLNSWWNLPEAHPQRDFLKYDFFQTLSIVGGFLLLVNLGPGGLSVDEKKKNF